MTAAAQDPREKQTSVPTKATRAFFDKVGGPVKSETFDPSKVELKQGEALVRLLYSGVCHSDLHALTGDWPLPTKVAAGGGPLVGGHEGAGVVVKLGPGAEGYVKEGDRVGIKWLAYACQRCDQCRRGNEACCPHLQCSGYTVDGTFTQYAVASASYLTHIPDGLPLDQAAPILCAGVTVYKALKSADIIAGDFVAIPGAGGGLGHLAVQYATACGYRVIAIDTGAEKRALCERLGAEAFIDFKTSSDVAADVRAASDGHGAHAAVVAAAGAAAYAQALDYIRGAGTLVAVGLPAGAMLELPVFAVVATAKTIRGSAVGNLVDCDEALRLAARGKVQVIAQTRGLSELSEVFKEMDEGRLAGRVVLDLDK